MNYTKPHDDSHNDTPKDWLMGSLIFSQALGLLIQDGEGILIKAKGDAAGHFTDPDSLLIIANMNGMISVFPLNDILSKEDADSFEEGTIITISEE